MACASGGPAAHPSPLESANSGSRTVHAGIRCDVIVLFCVAAHCPALFVASGAAHWPSAAVMLLRHIVRALPVPRRGPAF